MPIPSTPGVSPFSIGVYDATPGPIRFEADRLEKQHKFEQEKLAAQHKYEWELLHAWYHPRNGNNAAFSSSSNRPQVSNALLTAETTTNNAAVRNANAPTYLPSTHTTLQQGPANDHDAQVISPRTESNEDAWATASDEDNDEDIVVVCSRRESATTAGAAESRKRARSSATDSIDCLASAEPSPSKRLAVEEVGVSTRSRSKAVKGASKRAR